MYKDEELELFIDISVLFQMKRFLSGEVSSLSLYFCMCTYLSAVYGSTYDNDVRTLQKHLKGISEEFRISDLGRPCNLIPFSKIILVLTEIRPLYELC